MKKGWKIFWITCAVTAAVGFACCILALGLGVTSDAIYGRFPNGIGIVKGAFGRVDGGDYISADIRQSYGNVRELEVDLFAGQIEILTSPDDEITVETDGISEKLGFQCYADGDTLKVTSKKNLWNINNVGIGHIYIYIPQNMLLEEANVEIVAGSLKITDIRAAELSFDVGVGELIADNFYAGIADFDCGTGSITASGDVGQELNIDCGAGEADVTLTGRETDYNYDVECGVGEVICGDLFRHSGIARESSIDNQAEKEVDIDCGAGSVTVNFETI